MLAEFSEAALGMLRAEGFLGDDEKLELADAAAVIERAGLLGTFAHPSSASDGGHTAAAPAHSAAHGAAAAGAAGAAPGAAAAHAASLGTAQVRAAFLGARGAASARVLGLCELSTAEAPRFL